MNQSVLDISTIGLLMALVLVLPVLVILYVWRLQAGKALYAVFRMVAQLLLVGYVLIFLFEQESAWVVGLVIFVMITASSWIALNTLESHRRQLFFNALISISVAGLFSLVLVSQGILQLEPWYEPRYVIPIAGMIFANAMNTVSIAVERLYSELKRDANYQEAKKIAFQASMIPVTNSLFAVGLVSLPGMMTGQILSGVEPLVAVRYQIVVMCMIFGSAGIASAIFLVMSKKIFQIANVN
ncbi:MAG: ABC transporter permease [Gammaproteobacteria bacterium]|nr:ABC transporter permease [Gammaproteobacteria bacterium]MDH5729932.1 ABC transporter permease [Gammaproteobacteria bacterium]